MERQLWLVCYDIRDPKRLRKVYRTMREYGDHLQYSVFRCELSSRQRASMVADLELVIAPSEDQVVLVPLGQPDGPRDRAIRVLGQPMTRPERVCHVV